MRNRAHDETHPDIRNKPRTMLAFTCWDTQMVARYLAPERYVASSFESLSIVFGRIAPFIAAPICDIDFSILGRIELMSQSLPATSRRNDHFGVPMA